MNGTYKFIPNTIVLVPLYYSPLLLLLRDGVSMCDMDWVGRRIDVEIRCDKYIISHKQ